jgi:hypothetical protein
MRLASVLFCARQDYHPFNSNFSSLQRHGRQRDAEEDVSNGGESPELSINTRDTVTVSHSISDKIFTVN